MLDPHHSSRRSRSNILLAAVAWVLLMLLSVLIDKWAFTHWSILEPTPRALMESKDWYRLFRLLGYWPTWVVVGALFVLVDSTPARGGWGPRGGHPFFRGTLLVAATGLAGLAAEGVKVVARRARPIDTGGEHAWVPWTHDLLGKERGVFETSDLGFPSSHAAVAFGAAFILARLHPRSVWVLLPLAALCGMTRVWSAQHFLSDVVGAGVVGWATVAILWRFFRRNAR